MNMQIFSFQNSVGSKCPCAERIAWRPWKRPWPRGRILGRCSHESGQERWRLWGYWAALDDSPLLVTLPAKLMEVEGSGHASTSASVRAPAPRWFTLPSPVAFFVSGPVWHFFLCRRLEWTLSEVIVLGSAMADPVSQDSGHNNPILQL